MSFLIRKKHLFSILVISLFTVAGLLLVEITLRYALPKSYYIWPPHFKTVFKPNPDVMPGISGPAMFVTNSHGIRGDEVTPSHTYRILTIGGSTTECPYLDQYETWQYLLQIALNKNLPHHNVWVGNAGMSGKRTRHHLMAMQFLPLKEMMIDVIILLIGINDFSIRLSQDVNYDPDFLAHPDAMEKLVDETFTGSHPFPEGPFLKKTAIWLTLKKVKQRISQKHMQGNVQDETGAIYVNWRKNRQQASEIRQDLPDLSSAIEEYARNINSMIDIAQEKSIRLIFMTQPTMWKTRMPEKLDNLLWLGGIGNFQKESGKVYYSSAALEKGMRKYNDTLLNICSARRVECIDLSSLLNKDTTVFFDDAHFNEGGARKVSRILSNYILIEGLKK